MSTATATLPLLRSELTFTPVQEGRDCFYVIEDPVRHIFFRIGVEEYLLATSLNRARSLDRLLETVNSSGRAQLSSEQALTIINWLGQRQLLQQDAPLETQVTREQLQKEIQRFSRLNLISFKLPLFNPDPLLERLPPFMTRLAGLPFLFLWLLLACSALFALTSRWHEFSSQTAGFFSGRNLLIIWLIWFSLKILHEFFHALVCKRYGGRVCEAGILFILFIPLTYVEATSSWTFPSRWQRIHVAMAGILIETAVAWAAILVWADNPSGAAGFIAHNTALMAGISSLLFNGNPLMRFDGYYVLSDLVSVPNLYALGFQYIKNLAARWFFGIPPVPLRYRGARGLFIRLYGAAIFCWRILVVLSLGYLASMMAGGLGIFVTMGAALVWIGMPLYTLRQRLPLYHDQNPDLVRHLSLRLLITLALAVLFFSSLSWQKRIRVPAVVEFQHQASIRAEAPGFVRIIAVADGDRVQKGDPLLILANPDIETSLQEIRLEIRQLEIRSRLAHSSGRLTDYQILKQQRLALEQERRILARDRAALSITSPAGGMVIAPDLTALQDTWLRRGQEILWIIRPDKKHIVGAASQDDIHLFRSLIGKQVEVDMRSSGLGRFRAPLTRVAPTAGRDLPHPALAALYGGPMNVRQLAVAGSGQDMEQRFRIELFQPAFKLDLAVPGQIITRLRDGQLASILVRGDRLTPGRVLGQWWRHWAERKQKRAGNN